jgi:STE24 endopeptidase
MLDPQFIWIGFVAAYSLQFVFSLWLEWLNYRHLRQWGNEVPSALAGCIDPVRLTQIRAYTVEKSRLGTMEKVASDAILLGIILFAFLPLLHRGLSALGLHPVLLGASFFASLGLIFRLLSLPFDYLHTFVIEEKYGFNRTTPGLWLTDLLKEGAISLALLGIVLTPLFWLIRVSPDHWWIWGFLVVSLVQILLVGLYPILIAPLFNKFEPFEEQDLVGKIRGLMQEAGIRIKAILKMDAGKRSRHTNAYFTGLGKTKRIVLFDTLVESHPPEEVLGVLGHEAGHLKGRHILKQLILSEAALLVVFFLTHRLMGWPSLYSAFGFDTPRPELGLLILGLFWERLGFFLLPVYMAVSRRFEREADRFAARLLKTPVPLVTGLKRLAADNLSNLTPHPLYVWFHYSHPPILERVKALEKAGASG